MKKNILRERHKDLVNMLVRCRITIEERENPTVLDIMTDMRALNGVVTVRQTRPLSEIVSTDKQKINHLFFKGKKWNYTIIQLHTLLR